MKDWHLMVIVMLIVTIDILLIGLLSIYEGGREKASLILKKEHPSYKLTGVSHSIGKIASFHTVDFRCASSGLIITLMCAIRLIWIYG